MNLNDYAEQKDPPIQAKLVKQLRKFPTPAMLHVLYLRGYRGELEFVEDPDRQPEPFPGAQPEPEPAPEPAPEPVVKKSRSKRG